ncbi:ATPase 4, plasma membrane-type [Choanephora cucurbitarum]|uniref:ATPase 4, plasma membrane-type n=1 Tax=Choanephora cucurbitarum TaxID=101091 RepID=A0A1C7NQR2_9FUNG|nr:ATPase 4, plasma membrane-type [Choanephora cucurbitarum]
MAEEQPHAKITGDFHNITVEELYDKEKYDLSTMEQQDVMQLLQTQPEGLTTAEAEKRTEKFGRNKLETKDVNPFFQFLGFMWNPLSWVMEAAAIVAIALSNGFGKPPDYPDFIGIVLLLLANATIGFLEERQAGNAVKALMASLAPECKVKRDGEWKTMEAAELVPGDIISVKLGDVIPADGRLLSAHGDVSIDQAALTGESLPVATIKALNDDVDEFARRGLRALAVAIDEIPSGEVGGEGIGFKLVGLLPIYDPPRSDTKETIDRSLALGVAVKMITGDQLAIAKETGRRLGMGDNMFLSKTLKEGPPAGSGYTDVDQMVLHADGFAGVYPEHKYEIVERLQNMGYMVAMTGDGVNDAPALSKANVGVAVADASDAARSAADIVLTAPGLSTIVEAIIGSRQIFQRMRNYSIYTCSVTIRVVVGFSILIWAFQFDFPPFMILIIAILNDGTIMTISKDRVKPSPFPDAWNLKEIFSYAIVYGLYLTASTVAFVAVALKTSFFQSKFGIQTFTDPNDYVLHSAVYLQVSTISQALIFITRSRGWFFTERPSILLVISFIIAQLVAMFISVYANWGFTSIQGTGWSIAGIVWIWNFVWFAPMDLIKFAMQRVFEPRTNNPEDAKAVASRRASQVSGTSGRLYANRTRSLRSMERPQNFANKIMGKSGKKMDPKEMRRFSSVQTSHAAQVLGGNNS